MEAFRTTEVISLSFVAYTMLALLVILAVTYALLFFAKKNVIALLGGKASVKNITVIETQYAAKIGHICLISVASSKYLIVHSTSGIAIAPVSDVVDAPSENCSADIVK